MRIRRRTASVVVGVALLSAPAIVSAGRGSGPKGNVIEFVTHPKNNQGQVVCALFDESGWLKKPLIPDWATISNKTAICRFSNVPEGIFGISAYHDENRNGKLDTNAIGLPIEDYGASRDARGTFGPPSFDDAKFIYRGKLVRLSAKLK
jgi:uncharacterized protein (DUF2141 family)